MKKSHWVVNNSLWLASLGLMLASSGLDGKYMSLWMPDSAQWLGYVLNTVSDISSMAVAYWWGRLRQFPKHTKRYKLATVLLPTEFVAILYSWFFSWRQLLRVLPQIEGTATYWVAPIAAGFIPLLLAAIGYAQALLAGRIEKEAAEAPAQEATQEAPQGNGHAPHRCPYCGAEAGASGEPFATKNAVSAHLRHCAVYKAHVERRVAAETADV